MVTRYARRSLTVLEIIISTSIIAIILIVTLSVFRVLTINSAHVGTETLLEQTLNTVAGTIQREMRHALATTVGFDNSTSDTPISFREAQFRKVVNLNDQGRPIIGNTVTFKVDEKGDFLRIESGKSVVIGSFGATGDKNDSAGLVFLPITEEHDIIEFIVRVIGSNRKTGEKQQYEKRIRLTLLNKVDTITNSGQ